MSNPRRATRTAISRAIEAAMWGTSTTLTPSSVMSLDNALAIALRSIDTDARTRGATAYVSESLLYIGPRKPDAQSARSRPRS